MMNEPRPGPLLLALAAVIATGCCIILGCSQQRDVSPAGRREGGGKSPAATTTLPQEGKKPGESKGGAGGRDPAKGPSGGQGARPPDREPLFVDWPDPRLALFLTGRLSGYIEPCGCTGLTNQKGGLSRRHTLQQQLAEKGWPLVAIDSGNQVRRYGPQAEIKFQVTVSGLMKMNYRAVALGPDDLRLSAGVLVAVTAGDGDKPSPFVSANVSVLDPALTPRYIVAGEGGKKVGITAILGDSHRQEVATSDITVGNPAEGLGQVWPQLEREGCDLYVLLADAETDESKELGRRFPGFDVVVTTGGAAEPTYRPETIPGGDSMLVQVGTKGMYVVVVGVFDDKEKPLRYQRVPLDARFPDSPDMLKLLASYQSELERTGFQRLGLNPIPHPSGYTFVGSEACRQCHTKAFAVWEKTKHAQALQSLVRPGERSEIPRHFDPECVCCHVVGWNPQKPFPYKSGYLGIQETPALQNVGCENCHGPGSAHAAAEDKDAKTNKEQLTKLREAVRLPLKAAEETCLQCHDLDNSVEFHQPGAFLKYWGDVQHEGMD